MQDLHRLAFSFVVENKDGGEVQISHCTKQVHPRKGEYIWMPYNWERKKEFGTRAFIVEDVAHHMPSEKMESAYDNIVVYCTPVINADEKLDLKDRTKVIVTPNELPSSQAIPKPNFTQRNDWACNSCGLREYTDCVSQDDLDNWLQCSCCGNDEFHLEPVFDDK